MARNPLYPDALQPVEMQGNDLIGYKPTLADGWDYNAKAYNDWVAQQQADLVARGLNDPQTGWPTQAGYLDAAKQVGNAIMLGTTAPRPGLKLSVRPSTDDIYEVLQSNFKYGKNIGPKTVPIDTLKGGVDLTDPQQAARISNLKDAMMGDGGYISRPIVDTNGNVVEGQHRLEALRQLGVQKVPVHVIQDLSDGVDINGLHDAITQAQPMRSDNRTQITQQVLEALTEQGSPGAVSEAYEPPTGYEAPWNAALDFLAKPKPSP